MGTKDPGQEGIDAAREDNRRAREISKAAELAKRGHNGALGPVGKEKTTRRIASKSANCLHQALGYLEAALGELDEASTWTEGGGAGFNDRREAHVADELLRLLEGSEGLRSKLHHLRDVRAARAGFSFDEET